MFSELLAWWLHVATIPLVLILCLALFFIQWNCVILWGSHVIFCWSTTEVLLVNSLHVCFIICAAFCGMEGVGKKCISVTVESTYNNILTDLKIFPFQTFTYLWPKSHIRNACSICTALCYRAVHIFLSFFLVQHYILHIFCQLLGLICWFS
jgi:hypothetical protein